MILAVINIIWEMFSVIFNYCNLIDGAAEWGGSDPILSNQSDSCSSIGENCSEDLILIHLIAHKISSLYT